MQCNILVVLYVLDFTFRSTGWHIYKILKQTIFIYDNTFAFNPIGLLARNWQDKQNKMYFPSAKYVVSIHFWTKFSKGFDETYIQQSMNAQFSFAWQLQRAWRNAFLFEINSELFNSPLVWQCIIIPTLSFYLITIPDYLIPHFG